MTSHLIILGGALGPRLRGWVGAVGAELEVAVHELHPRRELLDHLLGLGLVRRLGIGLRVGVGRGRGRGWLWGRFSGCFFGLGLGLGLGGGARVEGEEADLHATELLHLFADRQLLVLPG